MTNRLPLVLLLFLFILASGCSPFYTQGPEKHFYWLQASRNQEQAQVSSLRTLRVQPFFISEPFAGQELVVQTEPGRLAAEFNHRFFSPPAQMITESCRNWLARSALFSHVLPNAGPLPADYLLQGRINALYVDQTDPDQHQTVLDLEFLLWHQDAAPRTLLGQESFQRRSELSSTQAAEAVQAWNQDLENILQELEEHISVWLLPERL